MFALFDALNQIFTCSNYSTLKVILDETLFDILIVLFSLDEKEYELYS